MLAADVDRLVEIHSESWAPHELSVKLGRAFLQLFYSTVAEGDGAFGYVHEIGGTVVGYAIGFVDYSAFNHRFLRRHRWALYRLLLRRMAAGRVTPADVVNLLLEKRKMRNARFSDSHLGALALATIVRGTPAGRAAITSVMSSVVHHLRRSGHAGCSCVCDFRNAPLRRYLERLEFGLVDVVPMVGKRLVLYETIEHAAVGRP
jgi:hypothetical protein